MLFWHLFTRLPSTHPPAPTHHYSICHNSPSLPTTHPHSPHTTNSTAHNSTSIPTTYTPSTPLVTSTTTCHKLHSPHTYPPLATTHHPHLPASHIGPKDSLTISIWNHKKATKMSGFLGCVKLNPSSLLRNMDTGCWIY